MSEKEFKAVEGVRNIHIAQIDIDNTDFFKPRRIQGLGEIKVTKTYKEGSMIGDMEVMLQKKKLKQLDVSITANELPPEIEAVIHGMNYVKGELVTSKDDNQNPVAILWEEVYSDGSIKYCAVYNIKLARDEKGGNGNSDNIDFQTISLSGTGLYSDIAKGFMLELFDDDEDVDKEKIKYFFDRVQYPKVNARIPFVSIEYTGYTSGEVTDISLVGVKFSSGIFNNVPGNTTTFTFKLDSNLVTATFSDSTWTFA